MTDTILSNGVERQVHMLRSVCQNIGERTKWRVKRKCDGVEAVYLPAYRCSEFRLCSPFGQTSDPDLVQPCEGCHSYQPSIRQTPHEQLQ